MSISAIQAAADDIVGQLGENGIVAGDCLTKIAGHVETLAASELTRREKMILALVAAQIAASAANDDGTPFGGRIEERRTFVMLAALWADEVLTESAHYLRRLHAQHQEGGGK